MKRKVHKAVVEERADGCWTLAMCLTTRRDAIAFRWGGATADRGFRFHERGIDRAVRFLNQHCKARHVHA